ncbi:MAG: GH92 family glycosyl hydrolase [Solirubrobacteraceae bacterium]
MRVTAAWSIVVAALLIACIPADAPATPDSPLALVNPFIGTQDYGNTFPGAALPFGMVQLSPDNGGQAGYDHDNTRIDGFSHTHLSGVGCGALGEVRVMPTAGAVSSERPARFGSPYRHDTETARPGYYSVDLTKYGIRAELSATTRTGWHRYTFPAGAQANVLFDVGRANMPVFASTVDVAGDRTLEGSVQAGGFCGSRDRHRVFFSARFDRPFAATGTWRGGRLTPAGRHTAAGRDSNGAWVTFDTSSIQTVGLQVGISYASLDGARRNLSAEADGQSFDGVVRAAADRWASMLARAKVDGGSGDRRIAFTTALYHALLHPNVIADVDGAYPGADGRVHPPGDHTAMGNLSLWDTFRTQNQLLELVAPDVARDVALSVLDGGRRGGGLPRWSLAGAETNIMTGDPVTSFLVENWSAGLLAGHEQEAYRALRANALGTPPAGSRVTGRAGLRSYARHGYIASGLRCRNKGGGTDCSHPASATLEYAAADASLALMARALGHGGDARRLARRARGYRTLWDRRLRVFRPRGSDGRRLAPYDPRTGADQFHEGGAYQYQWLVPQDPAGLVGLLGGRRAAAQRLDAFFDYRALLRDPSATAHHAWVEHPYEYYGAVTYNPNNEPDLHAPYLYAWTGQPWKTATVVRAAETLFTNGPEGMTGNDDLGTVSAWYVLSSLGLYPTMSGGGFFVLSTPQFPHAELSLGAIGSRQGGTLTIDAPGTSAARRYVAAASIGGRPVRRTWLTRAAVAHGGRLAFTVSPHPTRWGTAPGAAPPSVVRSRPAASRNP